MPKVPVDVKEAQYVLRSTLFNQRLIQFGFNEVIDEVEAAAKTTANLDWTQRDLLGIETDAWNAVAASGHAPSLFFMHPILVAKNPRYLLYYRSLSLLSQKGLQQVSGVSNVKSLENGVRREIKPESAKRLAVTINKNMSAILVMQSLSELNRRDLVFTSAGAQIQGSWNNKVGTAGEDVVRTMVASRLLDLNEIASIVDTKGSESAAQKWTPQRIADEIRKIRRLNLSNSYTIIFAQEPDLRVENEKGEIVAAVEVKAGIDPGAALERLGAIFKSFDKTQKVFPDSETILVLACMTDEVQTRLQATRSVGRVYILTSLVSDKTRGLEFINVLRAAARLVNPTR